MNWNLDRDYWNMARWKLNQQSKLGWQHPNSANKLFLNFRKELFGIIQLFSIKFAFERENCEQQIFHIFSPPTTLLTFEEIGI